jgi:hypothetical protein
MSRRAYKQSYSVKMPVITCPNCGEICWPLYRIAEGTGVARDGRVAPRRRKSLSPIVPFSDNEQERPPRAEDDSEG